MTRFYTRSIVFALFALFVSTRLFAATVTVTSTADSVIAADGKVTLREAMTSINTGNDLGDSDIAGQSPGVYGVSDAIHFNIAAAGVHTIAPVSPLPAIAKPVLIDGYTQPGSSPNTHALNAGINAVLTIEIDLAASTDDLHVAAGADGTTIRGLVLNNRYDEISVAANNVTVAGNFIGTDTSGTIGKHGTFGIVVQSLPNNLTVGGPAAADRNLISGHLFYGVELPLAGTTTGHLIQGNYIGTDTTGTLSLDTPTSLQAGIVQLAGVSVLDNLISGNSGGGVQTVGAITLRGNLIGTQRDGISSLPTGLGANGFGVFLHGTGSVVGGSSAGQPNVIAFNLGPGVNANYDSSGNSISQNVIHSNSGLGIDIDGNGIPLPNDPGDTDTSHGNLGQNYPVLTAATTSGGTATISGTLNGVASRTFTLEFFANATCDASGYGQGQTYVGTANVSTDASGNASFGPLTFAVPAAQSVITSTATNAAGNTSEFSQCLNATGGVSPTTISVVSSLNPSTFGQSVTFTATVTGGTAPTGTVQFKDGATNLGAPAMLAGTTATFTTAALNVGTHPVTAVYSGDSSNGGSSSPLVSQVVNGVAPGATTTSVVSSLNPSLVGQSVTFTATVNGTNPTGAMQFDDGANALGTGAVSAGMATFTTSTLALGSHPISAIYSGDATNATSTSATLIQVVAAPGSVVSAIAAPTLSTWMLLVLSGIVLGVALHRLTARVHS